MAGTTVQEKIEARIQQAEEEGIYHKAKMIITYFGEHRELDPKENPSENFSDHKEHKHRFFKNQNLYIRYDWCESYSDGEPYSSTRIEIQYRGETVFLDRYKIESFIPGCWIKELNAFCKKAEKKEKKAVRRQKMEEKAKQRKELEERAKKFGL